MPTVAPPGPRGPPAPGERGLMIAMGPGLITSIKLVSHLEGVYLDYLHSSLSPQNGGLTEAFAKVRFTKFSSHPFVAPSSLTLVLFPAHYDSVEFAQYQN